MIALRILAPVAGFLVLLIALFPLRFAVAQMPAGTSGFVIGDARGSVWQGEVSRLIWQGVQLDKMDVTLQPLPLLTGKAAMGFESSGPVSSGVLALSGAGWALDEVNGRLALSGVVAGLPPEASAYLTRGSLGPGPNGCVHAAGKVSVDGLPSPAPARLEGDLACDGGALTARLASPEGGGTIDVRIAIANAAGPVITATSEDAAMRAVLDMANIPAGRVE
jgi:hypothetical protein